jgi:hypothetical protein
MMTSDGNKGTKRDLNETGGKGGEKWIRAKKQADAFLANVAKWTVHDIHTKFLGRFDETDTDAAF